MSYSGTRVVPFASAAEILTGTQENKAIDPKQLATAGIIPPSFASAAEIVTGTEAAKSIAPDQLKAAGVNLGGWTTPSFSASDFTASGSMVWTVEAGDVQTYAYIILGKTMFVSLRIATTTVSGTPSADLYVKIPNSKVSTKNILTAVGVFVDNSVRTAGYMYVTASGTKIGLQRFDANNWSASTNNTSIYGQIFFEIN